MTPSSPTPFSSRDRDWIASIRGGDPAAFELLFRTYHPQLCDFAYRYVRSRDLAQELVSDVFARLWEDRDRLEVHESLKSLLFAAVRNRAISFLRHELVERRARDVLAGIDQQRNVSRPSPERQLETEELAAAIQRVLEPLPDRCRLALTLRWDRQLSYAEVAEIMGISVKTVEIYVARGLATLRENRGTLAPYL